MSNANNTAAPCPVAHFAVRTRAGRRFYFGAVAPAIPACMRIPRAVFELAEAEGIIAPGTAAPFGALVNATTSDPSAGLDAYDGFLRRVQALAAPGYRFGRFLNHGSLFWGFYRRR